MFYQAPKRTHKAKNQTNSNNSSEQVKGTTQQNKGFQANRTRTFTRTFGKIFVTQFLCGTMSVPELEFPVEPQSPNGKNINLHKKVGFPPIPERAPKSAQTALFVQKVCKKCSFAHFFGALSGIGGNPTSVQISVFAVRALRLDRKYTKLES